MTRFSLLALLLLSACGSPYRTPEESEPMRREIEDRNVESRVRIALAGDPVTGPYESIRVGCREGVVTLEGEVDRLRAKVRAVEIAEACEGVRLVVDRISLVSSD